MTNGQSCTVRHTRPQRIEPQLQREWHLDNNVLLGGKDMKPQSNIRAKRECKHCPAGKLHIFSTAMANRANGTRCPYCSGRRVCVHNSLATIAPWVATVWNEDQIASRPKWTLAGSTCKAEWRCPDCRHEWQARVEHRVRNKSGCPKCSQLHKQQKQMQPTFEVA